MNHASHFSTAGRFCSCVRAERAVWPVRRVPLESPVRLRSPILFMQLLMDKGTSMILLIDALHPDHTAVCINGRGLRRLGKRAAPGAKILRIEIINLPAFVAPYFPHCTHLPFLSQPVDLILSHPHPFEKSILQEILSLFRFPAPAERPGNQGSLPENGRLPCTVFICQARSDVRRVPFRVFLRFGNRLRLGLAVFRQSILLLAGGKLPRR